MIDLGRSGEPGKGSGFEPLVLMGDWCVPAGHDNQANENQGAYQRQSPPGAEPAISDVPSNRGRIANGRFLRLDRRGLMGDPFFLPSSLS